MVRGQLGACVRRDVSGGIHLYGRRRDLRVPVMLKLVKTNLPYEVRLLSRGEEYTPIAMLWMALCQEDGYLPARPDIWMEQLDTLLGSGQYLCFVLYAEDTPIGFMDVLLYDDPVTGAVTGMMRHLYVATKYRSTGAGRILLLRCLRSLKRGQVSRIIATAKPEKASMYQSVGFASTEVQLTRDL